MLDNLGLLHTIDCYSNAKEVTCTRNHVCLWDLAGRTIAHTIELEIHLVYIGSFVWYITFLSLTR